MRALLSSLLFLGLTTLVSAETSINTVAKQGLTNSEWKRMLTVSVNAAQRGTSEDVFEQSIWYTVGRANPYFTGADMHTQAGPVTLTIPEGTVTITSVDNPYKETGDKFALKIVYDLTYPIASGKGAYSIVINGALPLPALALKDSLRLQFWAYHNLVESKVPNLQSAIILNTFGGSILSDQMARLALSYGPGTDMVRTLPTYTISQNDKVLSISPAKLELISNLLKNGKLEHYGYTDRAQATEIGFAVNHIATNTPKPYSQPVGYKFIKEELELGLYSFEIRFTLPTTQAPSVKATDVGQVKGEILLSNIDFLLN